MGKTLYKSIQDFARSFGCAFVEMTASGWTRDDPKRSDRTRLEYCIESLGYEQIEPESSVVRLFLVNH